ncbi:RNA polymerase sigma factor SigZ [Ekhidna sp. MALMAid0563]|uniref:RNA polymerase sigma factor SigZ n=1 Tax=Ekhidna sp. MALMAid0563 TaxID=3143937 RepID=UPI0032DEEFA0
MQSIEYIWHDLHSELRKFILNKVQDHDHAEDILQEVFLKLHLKIDQLKDSTKLTSWVYQITRNTIIDSYRSSKTAALPKNFEIAEDENYEDVFVSLSECINSKIQQLPKEERDLIFLTYFKNCSQKELSQKFGISYSGTKSRIQRTRQKLKDNVLDCENVIPNRAGTIPGFHSK